MGCAERLLRYVLISHQNSHADECVATTATRINIPEDVWTAWDKTIDHGEDGSDSDVDDVEYKGKGHRLKRVRSLSSSEQDEASLLLVNASKHAKKRQGKEYHLNEGSSVA